MNEQFRVANFILIIAYYFIIYHLTSLGYDSLYIAASSKTTTSEEMDVDGDEDLKPPAKVDDEDSKPPAKVDDEGSKPAAIVGTDDSKPAAARIEDEGSKPPAARVEDEDSKRPARIEQLGQNTLFEFGHEESKPKANAKIATAANVAVKIPIQSLTKPAAVEMQTELETNEADAGINFLDISFGGSFSSSFNDSTIRTNDSFTPEVAAHLEFDTGCFGADASTADPVPMNLSKKMENAKKHHSTVSLLNDVMTPSLFKKADFTMGAKSAKAGRKSKKAIKKAASARSLRSNATQDTQIKGETANEHVEVVQTILANVPENTLMPTIPYVNFDLSVDSLDLPPEVVPETVASSSAGSSLQTLDASSAPTEEPKEVITSVPQDDDNSTVYHDTNSQESSTATAGPVRTTYELRSRAGKRNAIDDGISKVAPRTPNNEGKPPDPELPDWESPRSDNSVRRRKSRNKGRD